MLRILIIPLIVLGLAAAEPAAAPVWLTDLTAAKAAAAQAKKPLLVDFTGSDWCGWCIRLKAEVFDTPAFKAWAAANVILVEIDFPRSKPQDAATRERNRLLAERFKVEGFPTILFLAADGEKELGRLGYQAGGPGPWTAKAGELLK